MNGLDYLLEVLKDRGLTVAAGPDGSPVLRGPPEEATDALREMVALYREELIRRCGLVPSPAPPPSGQAREWLWYSGHRHEEAPDDPWLFGHADRHPVGAWFWRHVGEWLWRPVPGRGGEAFVMPAGSLNGGPPDERRSV